MNAPATLPRPEKLRDLLAASDDPHPRKTRRIEWVGEQSPLDNPVIAFNLLTGRYSPQRAKAIRWAAAKANTRVMRIRVFEHDHHLSMAPQAHLGRSYVWSEANGYVQEVDYRDVDGILAGPNGHEFRDVTDRDPDEPDALVLPPEVMRLVEQERVEVGTAQARARTQPGGRLLIGSN